MKTRFEGARAGEHTLGSKIRSVQLQIEDLRRQAGGPDADVSLAIALEALRETMAELEATNAELHEQHRALAERARLAVLTADVGLALNQGSTLQDMCRRSAEVLVRHLDAAFARIWTLDPTANVLELQASAGMYTHIDGAHSRIPVGSFKIGLIAEERRPHLTNAVLGDPRVHDQEWARREDMVAFAGYPLLIEDDLVGVMAMFARRPLTDVVLHAMGQVANAITLGIRRKQAEEHVHRLNRELERRVAERTRDLAIANEALHLEIADHKQAMVALAASEEKFKKLTQTNLDAIAINTFPEGRYVDVNDEWLRQSGFRKEEVIGRIPADLGFWADPSDVRWVMKELWTRGVFRNHDVDLRMRDGRVLSTLMSGVLVELDGRSCVVTFVRDISERKFAERERTRVEEDLRRALEKAEESDRLKSIFLASMSHEIRTPLNVIFGYAQLVAEDLAGAGMHAAREPVEAMARAGQRLVRTLQAVLDFSALSAGAFEVRPTVIPLAGFVERQIESFRAAAGRKGLSLSLEVDNPEARVLFDPHSLARAVSNLFDNAVKFTREGGIRVRVHRDGSDELCLEIRDTGVGIDPVYLPRLFSPFSQEKSGSTRPFEGSGLGLALVRRYLELNGARISVESEKGKGTAFRIHFSPGSEVGGN